MILLIGHTRAGELDLVIDRLRKLGLSKEFIRLNLNDIAYHTPLTVKIGNNGVNAYIHHPIRGKVSLLDAKLGWIAYAPTLWTNLHNEISSWPLVHAIEADLNDQFRGLYKVLNESGLQWVSDPEAVMETSKITELIYAQQIGFRVPTTLVTAYEPELAKELKTERTIVKTLRSQSISPSETDWLASYTKILKKEEFRRFQEKRNLNAPPVVLQPYIEKEYEVRLFFFLERWWALKINSRAHDELKVDWRKNPHLADANMERMDVPKVIISMAKKLMQKLGIGTAGFDFIVSKDGEWHFLEVNRTPSWNWMSKHVGEDIATGIAEELARKYTEIA